MISTERGARVEDFPALDVNRLARGGFLAPGDHLWTWEEADRWPLRVISLGDRVEIRLLGATLGEVSLDSTPCHFGGRRPWWRCPRCDARRARLYLHGGVLCCRLCADLRYESQLEREVARGLRRARGIRERLGGSPRLVDPFPPKPSRMRWATYDALRAEAARAEADFLLSLAPVPKRVRREPEPLLVLSGDDVSAAIAHGPQSEPGSARHPGSARPARGPPRTPSSSRAAESSTAKTPRQQYSPGGVM